MCVCVPFVLVWWFVRFFRHCGATCGPGNTLPYPTRLSRQTRGPLLVLHGFTGFRWSFFLFSRVICCCVVTAVQRPGANAPRPSAPSATSRWPRSRPTSEETAFPANPSRQQRGGGVWFTLPADFFSSVSRRVAASSRFSAVRHSAPQFPLPSRWFFFYVLSVGLRRWWLRPSSSSPRLAFPPEGRYGCSTPMHTLRWQNGGTGAGHHPDAMRDGIRVQSSQYCGVFSADITAKKDPSASGRSLMS